MSDSHEELLREVLARYDKSPNERLADVTKAAIRHLHAFVEEVQLQRDEWMEGIKFLTATGQTSDDVRQEFILLSDTLGVSSLVEFVTHAGTQGTTENTVLGPFFVPGSPERQFGESMLVDADAGDRVVIRGQVTNTAGESIVGVRIEAWQNASSGFYACQQPGVQDKFNLRGAYFTNGDGRFEIRTIRPVPYPIPDDGPAGQLLKANGRNWWRPGHTHLWFAADGYKPLITHVFDKASEYLDSDAVFGVRDSLIREFTPDGNGELATRFDVVLDTA